MKPENTLRKPDWLKIKLPYGFKTKDVVGLVNSHHLHTICTSGMCPNRAECWSAGTATFMICGNICSRNCKFCNVNSNRPLPLDESEPKRVAESVLNLKLKHLVITSVDRDDLKDQGASHWAQTLRQIKLLNPKITIEALIPDFQGNTKLIDIILAENPNIISHNLETVRRLTSQVRSVATYDRSLSVLKYIKSKGFRTKSGIMLGLGETENEILETMRDLRNIDCDVITIGQYLQPSKRHYPVHEYIAPEKFYEYGEIAKKMGFVHVESAPLVRSSYHAEKHLD